LDEGAHICFLGAVWDDRPNVHLLSPSLPFFWHQTDIKLRETLARHFGGLKKVLSSLHDYYTEEFPRIQKMHPDTRPNPKFPYRTYYTDINDISTKHQFTYVSQIDDKLVFLANTETRRDICVKFVRRYSKEMHMRCAALGIAPNLLGYEELAGGWHMVVMADITNGYHPFEESDISDQLYLLIKEKLSLLHQEHLVHGDIRDANIMVKDGTEAGFLLLDFDWSGRIQSVKYPINVYRGHRLWRPEGAVDGKDILAEHDMAMLDLLFGRFPAG
jgi:hypothetical protein